MRDVLFGCCALAVAAAYYAAAVAMPTSLLDDAVGPAGMPRIYGALLALLSVVTITRGLLAWRAGSVAAPAGDQAADERTAPRRVLGLLLIGAGYVTLVPVVGYVVAIALLLFATTCYQSRQVTRAAAVVALSGAVGLWLLFVVLLGIQQPAGRWPSLF